MKKVLSWFLLTAAAVMTFTGICMGQYSAVLQKAVRVCLECVGIG